MQQRTTLEHHRSAYQHLPLKVPGYWPTGESAGGRPVSLKSSVIQQGYCDYWPPNNSSCGYSPQLLLFGGRTARPFGGRTAGGWSHVSNIEISSDCAITKYLSGATAFKVSTGRAITAS